MTLGDSPKMLPIGVKLKNLGQFREISKKNFSTPNFGRVFDLVPGPSRIFGKIYLILHIRKYNTFVREMDQNDNFERIEDKSKIFIAYNLIESGPQ